MINWDNYRDENGTIKLYLAWRDNSVGKEGQWREVRDFFDRTTSYQEIKSRQVAALALSMADLYVREQTRENVYGL